MACFLPLACAIHSAMPLKARSLKQLKLSPFGTVRVGLSAYLRMRGKLLIVAWPVISPRSHGRKFLLTKHLRPSALVMISAVSRARLRSDATTISMPEFFSLLASFLAPARPSADSGISDQPRMRSTELDVLSFMDVMP